MLPPARGHFEEWQAPLMSLDTARNLATIASFVVTLVGVVVALLVYNSNYKHQAKQRRVANMLAYFQAHNKICNNAFIVAHLPAMEAGTFKRDPTNAELEKAFSRLLGTIEEIALFSYHGAISPRINDYMFGWFASQLQPVITSTERNNVYWTLAIKFLDEMRVKGDEFAKMTHEEREDYFKQDHFDA